MSDVLKLRRLIYFYSYIHQSRVQNFATYKHYLRMETFFKFNRRVYVKKLILLFGSILGSVPVLSAANWAVFYSLFPNSIIRFT